MTRRNKDKYTLLSDETIRDIKDCEVTVIIPARNCAGRVGRSIRSLMKTDMALQMEILVIDMGSEDPGGLRDLARGPVRLFEAGGNTAGCI